LTLLVGVAWQDQLLNGYRLITATVGSGMLVATSVASLTAALTPGPLISWLAAAVACVLAALTTKLVRRMREVTANRALDVNWWQRRLLDAEGTVADQPLTDFKSAQHERAALAPTAPSTGNRADDLLRKGRRHVRGGIESALFRTTTVAAWVIAAFGVAAAAL
jgi:hypothetical protein